MLSKKVPAELSEANFIAWLLFSCFGWFPERPKAGVQRLTSTSILSALGPPAPYLQDDEDSSASSLSLSLLASASLISEDGRGGNAEEAERERMKENGTLKIWYIGDYVLH